MSPHDLMGKIQLCCYGYLASGYPRPPHVPRGHEICALLHLIIQYTAAFWYRINASK